MVNFDANLGGHDRFWWANSDGSASTETYDEPSEARLYPGSWAPARFASLEQGVVAKHWMILGPFGGPQAANFSNDPRDKQPVIDFFEQASYPPDNNVVNPTEKFTGEQISGFWGAPREIGWCKATVADLDTRVKIADGGQLWYGATWVYAPTAVEVDINFGGHNMTYIRWFINGESLDITDKEYVRSETAETHGAYRYAPRTVQLKAGWNQFNFRAYCVGYPPFRIGLIINAKESILWNLKLSGTPQK